MSGSEVLAKPYWPLSGYYFFHFLLGGALFPYLSPYLLNRGFDAATVGELFAAFTITKLIAPFWWASIADRHRAHLAVVRWTGLAGLLCFAGFVLEPGFGALLTIFVLYSFFWNGTLPQFEALTIGHLGRETHRYARIRLWGSVGYIAGVAGVGVLIDVGFITLLPVLSVALMACVWLWTWTVPPANTERNSPAVGSLLSRLRQPAVIAFLICCMLMQMSHGPYYTFYSVYLGAHGYAGTTIGMLWSLGVLSEIVLFLFFHRMLERYSVRLLMVGCFAITSARWCLLGWFPDVSAIVIGSQVLHAVSYGAFHAISISLLSRFFDGMQGRGQALYAAVSFGLGGALGSLWAGYLWDGAGSTATFLAAGAVSAMAGAIAWRWVRIPRAEPAAAA